MSKREDLLGKVRRATGADPDDRSRRDAVEARLRSHPKGVVPKRGQLPKGERVKLFCDMAEKAQASVRRLSSREEVPAAVADYLREHNLPARVRLGEDERLNAAPWAEKAPSVERLSGPSDGADMAGLSHAGTAIAETGTLVLTSGADNPTTLNFLPDHHMVVLDADDVSGGMEDAWTLLRERTGGSMPRTVNFITGPSRSGDIEQTILLGAHGPRRLHVMVVG